jgi:hypothetical protein
MVNYVTSYVTRGYLSFIGAVFLPISGSEIAGLAVE